MNRERKKQILALALFVILITLLVFLYTSDYNMPFKDDLTTSQSYVGEGNMTITVTGDVMFGRKMPAVLSLDESPYRFVENVTKNTDILLVNTENPFTASGNAVKPDVPLKASPEYIPLINGTSKTVISANANNHVFDYGVDGVTDSINNLDEAGIIHIGAGENKSEATKPAVLNVSDHKVTIFNYMDSDNFKEYSNEVMPIANDTHAGYSAWDPVESPKQISEAKNNNSSDFVLVYMHYGNEYSRSPNDMQVNISHAAIDAGADAVVGAHAHVTQGIEMYKDKPIFYNLGNFMFDQSNTATHRAYMVEFNVTGENVTATVYPIDIINYLPHFMSSSDGKALLEELNPQCPELEINDDGQGVLKFRLGNNTNATS